jgi:hypothetical protein
MSFLIDPALLYAGGRTYARIVPEEKRTPSNDAKLVAGYMALFWGVSVGLYLDQRWTKPVWKACRAESGRDWMLNSGVFRFDWRRAGPRTHKVSTAIFATYPLWLVLGMRRRRASGD